MIIRSSKLFLAVLNGSVHIFLSRMDFSASSAVLGLFQKSGAEVSFSSSSIKIIFFSMSKEPPQSFKS